MPPSSLSCLIVTVFFSVLTSRLLQALLAPKATFLFITRHPLAVALAHKRWASCARMSIGSLVLHYVVSHRILAADLPHLSRVRVLRYEDLVDGPKGVGGPKGCTNRVLGWLGLRPLAASAFAAIASDTNAKYEREYCHGARNGSAGYLATPAKRQQHCAMAAAMQMPLDLLGLGYDVTKGNTRGFRCLQAAARCPALRGARDPAMSDHVDQALLAGLKKHAAVAPPSALSERSWRRVQVCDHARRL